MFVIRTTDDVAAFGRWEAPWRSGVAEDEAAGFGNDPGGLVAVGRMSAGGQFEQAGVRRKAGDAADLLERAVLVVLALDGEQRHPDAGHFGADVPCAEGRGQPGIVPAPERRVDVCVVARQALAQAAAEIEASPTSSTMMWGAITTMPLN
jgi:hypothetical protein